MGRKGRWNERKVRERKKDTEEGGDYSCNLRYLQSATHLATRSAISLLLSSAASVSLVGDLYALFCVYRLPLPYRPPVGLASVGDDAAKHANDFVS